MKIISKQKDYYDFMSFRYGIDEKLILDRTDMINVNNMYQYSNEKYPVKISIAVCGERYDGILFGGKYHWHDDRLKFAKKISDRELKWNMSWNRFIAKNKKDAIHIYSSSSKTAAEILLNPTKTQTNDKYNCPIILLDNFNRDGYHNCMPNLNEVKFGKVLSPENIFIKLSNWLSTRMEESRLDNQTDIEKLEAFGFDKKVSFRH